MAQVAAVPAKVWSELVTPAHWWNPQHSWSGMADNLTLEPRAGGCFCEKLADGGSVRHMEVMFAAPGKVLRLAGALGPLQTEALAGALSFDLAARDGGTQVTLTYKVGGYSSQPFTMWGPAVDGVLGEQLGRLKRQVETGKSQ